MPEDIEKEINKAFHEVEGVHASGEDVLAKELADDATFAENVKNTLDIFELFRGDGLAYAMPLHDVKGFIDALLSGEKRSTGKKTSEEERGKLKKAYDFLLGLDNE